MAGVALAALAATRTPLDREHRMNLHQFRFVQEAVRRQPEPHRDGEGAVHLAARHLEGHPGAGRGTGRRHLRAPRQAPARVTEPGQQVLTARSRSSCARSATSSASATSSRSRTPARCPSRPRTRRRVTSCPNRSHELRKRYPKVNVVPAPGHAAAGGADADGRRGRGRPRHRIPGGRTPRTGHPALLRMAARDGACRKAHRWRRWNGRRWSNWPPNR